MPEHTLEKGKQVIEGLTSLGQALDYFVRLEMPVKREQFNPSAVDVAWLSEKDQEFPLMIFEVESSATNTIANNAVKVLGQPNQEFEKPLFFFHIIVRGGQHSSHIEPLRTQFGTHNYRHYRLALKEDTILVKDIFSQHRRITRKLDLSSIILALRNRAWQGIDLESVLLHIEALGFESGQGTFLPSYALLSKKFPELQKQFLRYLRARFASSNPIKEYDNYPSYLGHQCSYPIHIGLLTAIGTPEEKVKYLQKLQQWQDNPLFLPSMIGPHFGLSRDYDWFILNFAGPLWALVAALMHDLPEAGLYIAQQCRALILEMKSAPPDLSIFTALWMLHIAASSELAEEEFEIARNYINERGGIPAELLYEPPEVLSFDPEAGKEAYPRWISNSTNLKLVPALKNFRVGYNAQVLTPEQYCSEAITLGIDALIEEEIWNTYSSKLVHLLLA